MSEFGFIVLPGRDVIANLIYLDLDNLHDLLEIKTIRDIYLIDGSGDVELMEVFNLDPPGGGGGVAGGLNCAGSIDPVDVGPFIELLIGP